MKEQLQNLVDLFTKYRFDEFDEDEKKDYIKQQKKDIAKFEKKCKVELPSFLKSLLENCGSAEIGSFETYTSDELKECCEEFFEIVDEEPENYPDDIKDYFPIADSLDGDEFMLNINECKNAEDAPIYQWDHEECELEKKYDSFVELISDILEEWKEEDEDDELSVEFRDELDAILN